MGRTLMDVMFDRDDTFLVFVPENFWNCRSRPKAAYLCPHLCCRTPTDPSHQHLFEPSECLDCQAIERGNR
jgi:hypothetical protein